MKLSDQVRALAQAKYVRPAILAGKEQFSVAVKELMQDLVAEGFPPGNTPQVCSALRKRAFLREEGIEIDHIDGPPSGMSTTVVFHYRAANPEAAQSSLRGNAVKNNEVEPDAEDADAWALRLTEKIRGSLKDEIAQMGGAEAFIRWVRSDDEDAA
jgi:hypothetical protein